MAIRKSSHKPYPKMLKLLCLGGLVLLSFYLLTEFNFSRLFPIRNVHIYGVNRTNQQELEEILSPLLERGYFAARLDLIRNRLRQLTWVSDILVRRTWPDSLDITVQEKNVVAQWKKSGLLSDNGEIFSPKLDTYPNDIPIFDGPPGKQLIMLEHFKNINRILAPLHAKITYLELSPYAAWKLKLDNGVTLQLGHKDVLTALEHFVKVYPKIIGEDAANVDYVDLRYPNGVAVRKKTAV